MLAPIRKFSTSIYAKVLLLIIIIPFIFWGMGSSITGGNKNIVVVINKEKYSVQDLGTFIKRTATKEVQSKDVENFLYTFVGEKLIEAEIEKNNIILSDKSLSKLIKQQKGFKRNNEFSRTEYEKFLIKNNITAVNFEALLSKEEKRKQRELKKKQKAEQKALKAKQSKTKVNVVKPKPPKVKASELDIGTKMNSSNMEDIEYIVTETKTGKKRWKKL
mgnify:CR=1 FL=1